MGLLKRFESLLCTPHNARQAVQYGRYARECKKFIFRIRGGIVGWRWSSTLGAYFEPGMSCCRMVAASLSPVITVTVTLWWFRRRAGWTLNKQSSGTKFITAIIVMTGLSNKAWRSRKMISSVYTTHDCLESLWSRRTWLVHKLVGRVWRTERRTPLLSPITYE